MSACLVIGALLAVVVAHSMLAQEEVRLTKVQNALTTEQALHRQLLASVASAENPAHIVAEAKKLNLVQPSSVTQLAAVPLDTPLGSGASGSSSANASSGAGSTAPSG